MKILTILFLLIIFSIPVFSQGDSEGIRKGPNFKTEYLDGESFELNSELGDGPILLSFWATWCKPCLDELSEYKKLYKEFKEKGFKMYAIATDDERTISRATAKAPATCCITCACDKETSASCRKSVP